ncbi:hypothetical protein RGU70_02955 [Herbaspirillum sp. RTI4]|uniref:hypothetical protein n=1 Tax=Herbaspirillum sp. RTI4 TaxID=3048640 RepID=UPI002AB38789|nr:hypothetical protein [Herbaspirillum sp. RTI4]MDY7577288.1 hypothetical protein [Herbaspirillum sp. RTI4]MEA9982946.1 hypothetical protein [Herbaspirillum sp. RTI4]
MRRLRRWMIALLLVVSSASYAEGQYDPFSSKDPVERANAAAMRDAIVAGHWDQAKTFATTDALKNLYRQAQKEYPQPPAK